PVLIQVQARGQVRRGRREREGVRRLAARARNGVGEDDSRELVGVGESVGLIKIPGGQLGRIYLHEDLAFEVVDAAADGIDERGIGRGVKGGPSEIQKGARLITEEREAAVEVD